MLPLLPLLVGCALQARAVGLVGPSAAPLELATGNGATVQLQLDAESAPVAWLHGCVVEVRGVRVGKRILVHDWRVLDAGDGSGGFVGYLRAYGARIAIEDRNTRSLLLVDDEVSPQLRPWIGQPVLLMGYVTGGNLVTPVAWRLLAPAEEP